MNTAFNYSKEHSLQNSNGLFSYDRIDNKNNRFEIRTLEWMETQRPSWFTDPQKISRFEIIWIKKGKGILWVDEQTLNVSDKTIYCLAPGTARKFSIENSLEGNYISFTHEFIWLTSGATNNSSWIEQNNSNLNVISINIGEEMQQELEIIIRKMKWEFSNYFDQKLDLLKGLLNVFLIYFSRNIQKDLTNNHNTLESELVRKFLGSLKRKFVTQKLVIDYAGQLCVTPNHLNRIVKKVTGFTASHHIQQQIILEAKRKAIYSSVSMKEIAYSLGFDNIGHFSRFFKNNCGMSFTDFKNNSIKPG
ncbi:MAG: helix-turn-helix domain-containing protein [Bacteroidota bacterium]